MGMFISKDPIGLLGGDNVFAYAPNPTGWIDPLGLDRQFSVGGSGTAFAVFIGANFGLTATLSVPNNIMKLECYQLSVSSNASALGGVGAYAGAGISVGTSKSNGPLKSGFSGGTYRYGEMGAGWGVYSVGATMQGSKNIAGKSFLKDLFDWNGWKKDPLKVTSVSATPLPGGGFGMFSGAGYTKVGSYTTGVDEHCRSMCTF